jgi:hypothetical protein
LSRRRLVQVVVRRCLVLLCREAVRKQQQRRYFDAATPCFRLQPSVTIRSTQRGAVRQLEIELFRRGAYLAAVSL